MRQPDVVSDRVTKLETDVDMDDTDVVSDRVTLLIEGEGFFFFLFFFFCVGVESEGIEGTEVVIVVSSLEVEERRTEGIRSVVMCEEMKGEIDGSMLVDESRSVAPCFNCLM